MSASSVGAYSSAYAYLQSLLPPPASGSKAAGSADPVNQLLNAFYPAGSGDQSTSASTSDPAAPESSAGSGVAFCPDTMASLISIQGQQSSGSDAVAARAQSLFGQFDVNGDGQISKSEFESVFGSNADTSKVDGLFQALDANGDGSVSQGELTSAAQQSHAQHHHHHMHGPGAGAGGGLSALLSSIDPSGASSQTGSNADGSTSTTITYSNGSTVTMMTPASASEANATQTTGGSGGGSGNNNLVERLIQLQAQFLTPSTSQVLATV